MWFGIRVKSMVYTGLTIYGWNEKQELTQPPKKWLYWNWNMSLSMGFCICGSYPVYIYTKLSSQLDEADDLDSTSFAIVVFTCGELITILVICILASRIRTMKHEILFVTNGLFKYHKQVSEWLEEREIVLDTVHRKRILIGEIIIIINTYATFLFPLIAFGIVFHPLEAVNNMVKDWLEFDITIDNLTSLKLLSLMPPLFLSVLAAGNTVLVMCTLAVCSYLVTVGAVEDMTPIQVTQRNGGRYTFLAKFFGELEDDDIIKRYRAQKLFNSLTNLIFASLTISLHHVATLAIISIGAFVAIKFPDVLADAGIAGYVIVFGGMALCLMIEYLEATLVGNLGEIADTFKKQGNMLVGYGALFRVFVRSCQTLHVHAAYPFYTIGKTTFLEFVDAVMDKTIMLLLW